MASLEHDSAAKVAGEEHVEYESDSEEGTSALALRRRVASDDEEDDEDNNNERGDEFYAEAQEGGPPAEDEDEEEEEDEEADEEGEEYEDAEDEGGIGDRRKDVNEDYADEDGGEEGISHFSQDARKTQGGVGSTTGVGKEGGAEEKKDAEPFTVPTAGAFYMHDDRFRYNGIARPRRSAGGRKLWEAKDEKPWVHDRFEELKLNDESYAGQGVRGRRGRGRQGRVQGRGKDAPRARGRGHRDKAFDDTAQSSRRGLGRGRGLRRAKMDDYEFRESRSVSQKMPSSSHEATSLPATNPMQKPVPSQPASRPQEAALKKTTISSMLNISSPPFFPTGSISQSMQGFVASTSKGSEEKSVERETPQVRRMVNTSRSGMEREMTGFNSASVTRLPSNLGVNSSLAPLSNNGDVVETGLHRGLARTSSTPQQQLSKAGSGSIAQQQRIVRAEATIQHVIEQPLPQPSSRGAPSATQSLRVQSLSVAPQPSGKGVPPATQSARVQHAHQQLQAVNQGQIPAGQPMQSQAVVSPASFPAKPAADLKAAPASAGGTGGGNLVAGAMGRGTQAATMPAGRGALVYGNSSLTNGLRNVVQFSGQPQAAGLGVPAVGVALPGYSSQPQFSFPNSEVTWIPILAGGGSLNSNYSPPYIAVDGGPSAVYYAQQPSQVSAFPPTGDPNGSKTAASNSFKPPSRTEPDDLGQQRRRYSQMTFGEERR